MEYAKWLKELTGEIEARDSWLERTGAKINTKTRGLTLDNFELPGQLFREREPADLVRIALCRSLDLSDAEAQILHDQRFVSLYDFGINRDALFVLSKRPATFATKQPKIDPEFCNALFRTTFDRLTAIQSKTRVMIAISNEISARRNRPLLEQSLSASDLLDLICDCYKSGLLTGEEYEICEWQIVCAVVHANYSPVRYSRGRETSIKRGAKTLIEKEIDPNLSVRRRHQVCKNAIRLLARARESASFVPADRDFRNWLGGVRPIWPADSRIEALKNPAWANAPFADFDYDIIVAEGESELSADSMVSAD